MNAYQLEGPIFTTPETVLGTMRRVNTDLENVDVDMRANARVVSEGFLSGWNAFRAEWKDFYVAHQSSAGMVVDGTGTVLRQVRDFASRIMAWRSSLEKQPGTKLSMPPPMPLDDPNQPPPGGPGWGDLSDIMKSAAVIAGSVAVVWGLVELAPLLGLASRSRGSSSRRSRYEEDDDDE